MLDQTWTNAFGAELNGAPHPGAAVAGNAGGGDLVTDQGFGGLNIGVNVPTVVAGNGFDNTIHGNVAAIGDQHVGDGSGSGGINIGVNVPTVVAGNGVDNVIDGNVTAIGTQGVGDYSYHSHVPYVGDVNVGVNVATIVAGNGVGNVIGGDVAAGADQSIGHHGLMPF
jgi:hypothetical protein